MLGDQVADAGTEQRGGTDPPLDVVMLGPGRDRHRAERVAGENRRAVRRGRTRRSTASTSSPNRSIA